MSRLGCYTSLHHMLSMLPFTASCTEFPACCGLHHLHTIACKLYQLLLLHHHNILLLTRKTPKMQQHTAMGFALSVVHHPAEKDAAGLGCPVQFSEALKDCFHKADKQLLHWLQRMFPHHACTSYHKLLLCLFDCFPACFYVTSPHVEALASCACTAWICV